MKKILILTVLPLTCFAGTTVIQNYPNQVITETHPYIAWGVMQPNHCRSTFNWTTFEVRIENKPGIPAPKDAASCTRAWFDSLASFKSARIEK